MYRYIYTHTHTFFFPGYPLNPKSRSPRMLVIKKGSTKELQISGFSVGGSLHSQPVRDGTGRSVYKGLVPKPVTPPAKVSLGYQWHEQHAEKNHAVILNMLISPLRVLFLQYYTFNSSYVQHTSKVNGNKFFSFLFLNDTVIGSLVSHLPFLRSARAVQVRAKPMFLTYRTAVPFVYMILTEK